MTNLYIAQLNDVPCILLITYCYPIFSTLQINKQRPKSPNINNASYIVTCQWLC